MENERPKKSVAVAMTAKINDLIGDFAGLVGSVPTDENSKDILKWMGSLRGGSSAGRTRIGLCDVAGHPLVRVSGWIGDLPEIGPDSDWAWELEGGVRTNRRCDYDVYYHFLDWRPLDIPPCDKLLAWASEDAVKILKETYKDQRGDTKKHDFVRQEIDPVIRQCDIGSSVHDGEWANQLAALERKRPVKPFVEIGGEIKYYIQKSNEQAIKGTRFASEISNTGGGASEASAPFRHLHGKTAFIRGGAVALGAVLVLVGLRAIMCRNPQPWVTQSEIAQSRLRKSNGKSDTPQRVLPTKLKTPELSSKNAYSETGTTIDSDLQSSEASGRKNEIRGAPSNGWAKLEIGVGAGLMLLGALSGRGQGR